MMGGTRANPALKAMSKVLDEHRVPFTVEDGGKNLCITFQANGRRHIFTFPLSTGDWRSTRNAVASLCRRLRTPPNDVGPG